MGYRIDHLWWFWEFSSETAEKNEGSTKRRYLGRIIRGGLEVCKSIELHAQK